MTETAEKESSEKESAKSGLMTIIKRLVVIVVVLLLIAVGVSYLIPSHVRLERSIAINAPPEIVFANVNDLKKWTAWSPWYEAEPTADYKYSGAESGVGAKVNWKGEKVGEGIQEITKSEALKRIETTLDFGPQGTATSDWTFEATENGTNVKWGFDSDMGMNPVARYMGLMMESMLGPYYEKGLAKLKTVCEAETDSSANARRENGESIEADSTGETPTDGESETNSNE